MTVMIVGGGTRRLLAHVQDGKSNGHGQDDEAENKPNDKTSD